MAVTVLNSGINQEKGITYTVITDSSVDWTGVTNDTYFYDFGDGLVHYKDSTGTVLNMFASGGSSDTLYSDDGTVGSGRIVTLTDTLTFKGSNTSGSTSNLKIVDSTSSTLWDFRNNGDIHTSKNSTINLVDNITFKEGVLVVENGTVETTSIATFSDVSGNQKWDWRANGDLYVNQDSILNLSGVLDFKLPAQNAKTILFESTQVSTSKIGFNIFNYPLQIFENSTNEWWVANVESSILGNDGDFIIHNRLGSLNAFVAKDNGTILLNSGSSTSPIGTEDISLQGSTLVSDKFEIQTTTNGFLMPRLTTAQKNAISSPDTNLMVFDTDLNSLQRYNGSAWVAVAAGTGIVQLNQEGSSGDPVFYTDVQSALNVANTSGGDITITLHDNITTTAAISTNLTTNIDNITFDLNGFTITNTANDSSAVIFNKLQSNIITIINGSIIKTTGTGHALHFSSGTGDLYMSNCYVYSEASSALRIDASITPINTWELGGTTFKTNTGYGVYLADALGGVSLTNFISISTGSGMACFLNAGGDITNFKTIAEGTGAALRVRSNVTSATNFYAESNSGDCVLLESLNPMIKDFTAISVSGYAVFSSASAYKMENFYVKTTSGTRTIQAPANSILINGDVFSDSTDCAFIADAERVENVNFTTNSGTYAVLSRFTTNWINCTFRNKDGVAFYNYNSSTSKLKKCTFISEKISGGTAHAANIVDGTSVVTFVNCDFEVADSTVNCIKADAAMDMKVGNCSFDGSATPLSSNITLSSTFTSDPYGNITL